MKKAISANMCGCKEDKADLMIAKLNHDDRMRKLDNGVNEEEDPYEKNLPIINQTGGSQERSEKLASMARSQPSKNSPAPTQADKEKAANLEEARIALIKARIRGGKVQRRVKKSNVPGMKLQAGKLTRMSPAERRARKLGAKRGKIKRKAHMTQTLMKRRRSLQKRQRLGL